MFKSEEKKADAGTFQLRSTKPTLLCLFWYFGALKDFSHRSSARYARVTYHKSLTSRASIHQILHHRKWGIKAGHISAAIKPESENF